MEPTESLMLPAPVVQATLEYLSQRPYREVAQLMAALAQAKRVQVLQEPPAAPVAPEAKEQ